MSAADKNKLARSCNRYRRLCAAYMRQSSAKPRKLDELSTIEESELQLDIRLIELLRVLAFNSCVQDPSNFRSQDGPLSDVTASAWLSASASIGGVRVQLSTAASTLIDAKLSSIAVDATAGESIGIHASVQDLVLQTDVDSQPTPFELLGRSSVFYEYL